VRVLFLPDYREANAYQRALAAGLADLDVEVRADPTRGRRLRPVTEAVRRHGRPDIIHVHWTEPYIASGRAISRVKVERTLVELRAARRRGSRIVWTAHDLFRHDRTPDPGERRFLRGLVDVTSAVIVHCASAVDALDDALDLGPDRRERVHVIPHGHYVGRYPDTIAPAEARSRLGMAEGARVIAFVGWVRAYKGVLELVEAFGRIEDPSLRLVVAGRAVDDEYAERVRATAATDDRVRLDLGFVPDEELQVYLRAADVVAAPFLEIFTSGSVLLAMSFGRAVIAPRRGCVVDTLDEAGGLLYDAGDPHGLEGALRASLTADVDAMGRHNAASLERFAWPRIAAATRELYQLVLRAA
jgi:glycosyltransferase involved in cell wall biosynthesis